MGKEDKIKELEEELRKTPYNKRTQHHIGLVKAKLARMKEDIVRKASGKKKGEGYSVRKTGDASVALLGFPSVGKSTLLNQLTNAHSQVGSYDFTTLTVIPGLMRHGHAQIQILDVPGIVHGAASGKGRGREVLAVIRSVDLILILVDALNPAHYKVLLREVFDSGIRLNKEKPFVKISKKPRGGIGIGSTVKLTKIDKKTMLGILREFRLNNCDVLIRDNITDDDLIDSIEGSRVYIKGMVILNKIDLLDEETLKDVVREVNPDLLISAHKGINMKVLKKMIFDKLGLMRIFLKEVGKRADMAEPLIVRRGSTLRGVCDKLHKDFSKKFKYARFWGPSAKFDGQAVMKLDKKVKDRDVIEIHLK